MSNKCCITSCYPYSIRKGNVAKGSVSRSLMTGIYSLIIFTITKRKSPGSPLRMFKCKFEALIQSYATKKITVL